MKSVIFGLGLLGCVSAWSATRYVVPNNLNATTPYLTWATAAASIQQAVDVAQAGDTVLVTNGVYASGGRLAQGSVTNRVAVTNGIVLRSVNGPDFTFIVGAPGMTGSNGDGAVRCIYLGATNTVLEGFTLTNGHTAELGDNYLERSGGGAWCRYQSVVISNCVFTGNSAAIYGGGALSGTFYNSRFVKNWSAGTGGGSEGGIHYGSSFIENFGGGGGGGSGQYYNCLFYRNRGGLGGGINSGIAVGCIITGNHAYYGGGAIHTAMYHCTVTDNSAFWEGGGVKSVTARNTIIYYNRAPRQPNHAAGTVNGFYDQTTFWNVCTTPLPTWGIDNFTDEPQLASASHLGLGSACVGRGSALYRRGHDIDGQEWLLQPSVGADEFSPVGVTGPLIVNIEAQHTNVASSAQIPFRAQILGAATASVWNFGDGTVLSNRLVVTHSWSAPGVYPVRLTAFNGTHPTGVSSTVNVQVVQQPVHYVAKNNPLPVYPFTSWATAATNIQDAIGAGTVAGRLVLVADGIYDQGGTPASYSAKSNRVALTNLVLMRSVNGPANCAIVGQGPLNFQTSTRCAYVGNYSVLSGFTLTNGHAAAFNEDAQDGNSGAGAWCEPGGMITNCVIQGNVVESRGSGVYQGTLINSRVVGNVGLGAVYQGTVIACVLSNNQGGGMFESIALNSLISSNVSVSGGGAKGSVLSNCVLVRNRAEYQGGGMLGGMAFHCDLIENRASGLSIDARGGAAYNSQLFGCNVRSNYAILAGGGNWWGTNINSTFIGNRTGGSGGAIYGGWSSNCTISANMASNSGGGIHLGFHQQTTLVGNWAQIAGGGASSGLLEGCTLASNLTVGFGGGAVASKLTNCTLSGNMAERGGGGASTSLLVRCEVVQNLAGHGGGALGSTSLWSRLHDNTALTNGGGAFGGAAYSSLLLSNRAANGGGAHQTVLHHATVVGNQAFSGGGGVSASFITNSIVLLNTAPSGSNFTASTFNNSCTSPHPGGQSNLVNDPLFLNPAAASYRLRHGSPCMDAITNLLVSITNDLDGNLRPLDGRGIGIARPDMGAYEYNPQLADSNEDMIPDYWMRRYGLDPNAPGAAAANPDQDAQSTWEEWVADTNPTNAASFLRIQAVATSSPHLISFSSSSNRLYTLLWRNNAAIGLWLEAPAQIGIPGSGGILTLSATNNTTPVIYKIKVALP